MAELFHVYVGAGFRRRLAPQVSEPLAILGVPRRCRTAVQFAKTIVGMIGVRRVAPDVRLRNRDQDRCPPPAPSQAQPNQCCQQCFQTNVAPRSRSNGITPVCTGSCDQRLVLRVRSRSSLSCQPTLERQRRLPCNMLPTSSSAPQDAIPRVTHAASFSGADTRASRKRNNSAGAAGAKPAPGVPPPVMREKSSRLARAMRREA